MKRGNNMPKAAVKFEFEDALENLESIVSKLESGELSLEESIDNFEAGVKKYKVCKKLLDKAQKKISLLTDSLNEVSLE